MKDFERFGLTESPFGGRVSTAFAAVPSRTRPLTAIDQCLCDGQGIAVLTGNSGSGKTALCRELAERRRDDWLAVLLSDAGCTTRRSLLQAILYELGLPYTGVTEQEARLALLDAVREHLPDRSGLILLIDEAQRLNDRLLLELRSLINHEQEGIPLVRVLLCGDLVLEERLISPALESVNQRIACHETLDPLTYEESAQLIESKLVEVGGDGWEHVYTRPAMELICLASDGSPRNLEQLAKRSLLLAAQARTHRVTVEAVREALEQLKELPLQWNEPANLDAYSNREEECEAVQPAVEAVAAEPAGLPDSDDTVSVVVGDELHPEEWEAVDVQPLVDEPPPAAAVFEVGCEDNHDVELRPVRETRTEEKQLDELFTRGAEANLLLEDDAHQLADTAILEVGPGAPAEAVETVRRNAAAASIETSPDDAADHTHRGPAIAGPDDECWSIHSDVQPPSGAWTELEIEDAYAALDARHQPAIGEPDDLEETQVLSTRSIEATGAENSVGDETTILEKEILEDIHDLSREIETAVNKAGESAQRISDAPFQATDPIDDLERAGLESSPVDRRQQPHAGVGRDSAGMGGGARSGSDRTAHASGSRRR